MNNTKHVFLDMGHLQLFRLTTVTQPMGDGMIYYFDKRFPIEVGPFHSNEEAIKHWKSVLEQEEVVYQKAGLEFESDENEDNVIHVDFKTKKRI